MVSEYPLLTNLSIELRHHLHPQFKKLKHGISEFTFANIYLFKNAHMYKIAELKNSLLIISGIDDGHSFFMLPSGLPEKEMLKELFKEFAIMKCASEDQASALVNMGYNIAEDRNNFDYIYLRKELAKLSGSMFHKKKNLVNAFISNYSYEAKPLLQKHVKDAMLILDIWRKESDNEGDFYAAKEALEKMDELQLCGGIYYADGKPAAYTMGEELGKEDTFVIHFEKAVGDYKGLYQFVNQSFAAIIPEKYKFINREQDLGDEGLRQAKMTYRPVGFVKKYRAAVNPEDLA